MPNMSAKYHSNFSIKSPHKKYLLTVVNLHLKKIHFEFMICQELWGFWDFPLLVSKQVSLPLFQKTWDSWNRDEGLYYSWQIRQHKLRISSCFPNPTGEMEVALVNTAYAANVPQMRESGTEESNLLKGFKWTCRLSQLGRHYCYYPGHHTNLWVSQRRHAISVFQHFVLSRHSWRYRKINLSVLPFAKYVEIQETHGKLSSSVNSLRLFSGTIHFKMV